MVLDEKRFPLTAQYVSSLPNGIESYPECLVKADVRQDVRDGLAHLRENDGLPAPLWEFIRGDNKAEWIPEVVGCALLMVMRDQVKKSDEEFLQWSYDSAMALYKKPLYRVLMFILSPSLVVMGATKRWSAFHRSSQLNPAPMKRIGNRIESGGTLTFPDNLFNDLILGAIAQYMKAAIDAANAKNSLMETNKLAEGNIKIVASWEA